MTLLILEQIEQASVVLSPESEQFTAIPVVLLYLHVQFLNPPHDGSRLLLELPMNVEIPGLYPHDVSLFRRPWIQLKTQIKIMDTLKSQHQDMLKYKKIWLTLCLLGNFKSFVRLLHFVKSIPQYNSFMNTIRVSNGLHPD